MQKIFCVALLLVLLCAQGALADEGKTGKDSAEIQTVACTEPQPLDDLLLAGRGCCSHHRGQCGCEGGRVVCCDGSLSPSCTCEADTPAKTGN